jgi:hypothetical protein
VSHISWPSFGSPCEFFVLNFYSRNLRAKDFGTEELQVFSSSRVVI